MFKKFALFLSFPIFVQAALFGYLSDDIPSSLVGLDDLIEESLQGFQVPGVAVGVVVDGKVVFAKGYGYRDVEKKLPVNADTLFAIGSCTKAFTSFAMGNLVDDGLLQWDEPVIDILPEFRLWDQYATTNLTIRDLLTHRSGMPRHEFMWYNSKMSKSEMLRRIRYLQPSADIRERYQYGNLMYFIAGLAMERASEGSWENLVRERILTPLEMKSTNFSIEETQATGNFASPYIEKHGQLKKIPFRNLSLIGAAGALNSNINDMSRWLQLQLSGGRYNHQSLINSTTLQELHSPQVVVPGAPECKDASLYAYGIGWSVLSYCGHYLVSHDGISDGFTSVAALLPNEKIGIIVLSNKNMTTFSRYLSMDLMDRLLGVAPHHWLKEGMENIRKNKETTRDGQLREDRNHKKGTQPSHALEEYVGIYEHPGYGKLAIDLVGGNLQATYNDLDFVLGHWHYDVFSVTEEKQDMVISLEGMKFTFSNNANGDIASVGVPFEPTADDILFKRTSEEKHANINYLKQFTGEYDIYGYTVDIVLRNHVLMAIIPGQPIYELVPASENEFTVKTMTGSTVRFVLNESHQVEELLLIHPYGAFSALPKG